MTSGQVALLFPPITDPRGPHLAIPSLAATLRDAGVSVSVRDLDIEGLDGLLDRARLDDAARSLRGRTDRAAAEALVCADYVVDNAPAAPDLLRDPEAFYDPHRHFRARQAIDAGLRLLATARGGVEAGIGFVRYQVEGVHTARLDHLDRATADDRYDLYDELWPSLPDDLAEADLVGVSILNHQQIIPGLRVARRLTEAGHRVVIGGTVFAKFREQLVSRPRFFELFAAAVVTHEGESALLALLDGDGRPPNTLVLAGGRVVEGPTLVEDVGALPTPDFDGLPLDRYLAPEPVLPILTGKGCYFNRCKFCDIPYINRVSPRPYRRRSPEQVADDVATLARKHDARFFELTDEALAPRFLTAIGRSIAERYPEIEPRFVGYARFEPGFTAEALEELHAVGVRKLFFGLESGSQRMLDHMDKGVQLATARRILRDCTSAGVATHVFTIVGMPEEREEDARATFQFLLDEHDSLAPARNSFDVHQFTLDLRTDYYEEAASYGIEFDEQSVEGLDFPLAVNSFTNTRGLSDDEATELIAEFNGHLREVYPHHRRFPVHLWPSVEEYAILYTERYPGDSFRHRYTLPPADAGAFRLAWADDVELVQSSEGVVARTLSGWLTIAPGVVPVFESPRGPADGTTLVSGVASDAGVPEPLARTVVEDLLMTGVLVLEPA